MTICPFCTLQHHPENTVVEGTYAYVIYDKYPVNPGHALIVPKRHVADYFDLSPVEEIEMWQLVRQMKTHLEQEYHPSGYNIGINCGKDAGQTIFHLHIHLIPRYPGDMPNPEGGVRGVIPEKQKYNKEEMSKKSEGEE